MTTTNVTLGQFLNVMAQYWPTFRFNNKVIRTNLRFVPGSQRSWLQYDPIENNHTCNIGLASITANNNQDILDTSDITGVYCHIAHELRHAYQQQIIYQRPNFTESELNMFRMDLIAEVFPDYYTNNYNIHLAEIDANLWALKQTMHEFTNGHFDYLHINPEEALTTYFQTNPDMAIAPVPTLESYYNQLQYRRDHTDEFMRSKVLVSDEPQNTQIIIPFLQKYSKEWLDILQNFNKQGLEADTELFAAALDIDSLQIDSIPALENERQRVRDLYPSKIKRKIHRGAAQMPNYRRYLDRSEEEQKLFDMAESAEANDQYDSSDYTIDLL